MAPDINPPSVPTLSFSLPLAGRKNYQTYAVFVCLIGMTALLFAVLKATDGVLNYTLDDPYIHLALAENLAQGHYGVNTNEYASPSSSILYPFLVAAALIAGLGQWAPLVLNVLGALGTAWILGGLLWDALHKTQTGHVSWIALLTLPMMLVVINGFALGFTGMEHTLHVWASLAVIRGLIVMGQTRSVPWFLIAACIAAPFLRFEGAALSGAALLAVFLWGHWRTGLVTAATLAGSLAFYVTTMTSLGLPPMPSSVLVKSGPTAAFMADQDGAFWYELAASLRASLEHRQGAVLAGLILLVLLGTPRADKSARTVAFVAAAAGIAHLLVGRWGWAHRYEIYIIATLLAANLHVWAPVLSTAARRITTPALLLLGLPFVGYIYTAAILLTPAAAQNIYEQQHQMHRFATEFMTEPVAVTDLGWVAYDNDTYVLDLWGLGNENARQTYLEIGRTPEALELLTAQSGVAFAMLYDEVFHEGMPAEWCLIGQLETPKVTASFATVEFFLIDRNLETQMRSAMADFAAQLPQRVSLETYDC